MSKASSGWRNPEFQRNLWLEISPIRPLLMPGLIALLLFVAVAVYQNYKSPAEIIVYVSPVCFALLTIFWGSGLALSSLTREFSEDTWDNQRMSGLTPWQMVWGKLFGGTIYAWYGGVILLAVTAVSAVLTGMPWGRILLYGAGLVSLAVLCHAASMLGDLTLWHKNPSTANLVRPRLIAILGLPSLFLVFYILRTHIGPTVVWWSKNWPFLDITIYTLIAMTLWVLLGLWQAMRRELLLHNRPWWWLVFMVFWMLWGVGFTENNWEVFFKFCVVLAWFGLYLQLFSERKDQGAWLRIIAAWKQRNLSLIQHLLPFWTINFALVLVLSLVTLLLTQNVSVQSKLLSFLGITALVTRDIAWTLWLNLAPDARRADAAAILSLIMVYGLLSALGNLLPSPADALFMPLAVIPTFDGASSRTIAILSILVQAIIALWLFYGRWRVR
ncbi:hypothetical protein AGMMS50256_26570 [Betaproteobacteria bacterium]|nr:hypothetical protein AGMMS50256_26570 [Betaproteobacteria bacterium]